MNRSPIFSPARGLTKVICYKVSHKYKLMDHFEYKDIGIYSTMGNAEKAIAVLKSKNGFKETADGFRIKKVFRFNRPKFADKKFWIDGFDTYKY